MKLGISVGIDATHRNLLERIAVFGKTILLGATRGRLDCATEPLGPDLFGIDGVVVVVGRKGLLLERLYFDVGILESRIELRIGLGGKCSKGISARQTIGLVGRPR